MHPALVWLTSFVWTLALELPVYAALLRERLPGPWHACVLVVGVNLITHPALHCASLPPRALVGAELVVAVVEGLLLAGFLGRGSLGRALLASLAANAVSFTAGLVVTAWLKG